jgi:hypothetical protein
VNNWIILALFAAGIAGGGIMGACLEIMIADHAADRAAAEIVPATIQGAVVAYSAEVQAPSGGGRDGGNAEPADVPALPAAAQLSGTLERLGRPGDWETRAEEIDRLERRLVALSAELADELAADVLAVDTLLASGALACPEWMIPA